VSYGKLAADFPVAHLVIHMTIIPLNLGDWFQYLGKAVLLTEAEWPRAIADVLVEIKSSCMGSSSDILEEGEAFGCSRVVWGVMSYD